VTRLLLAVCIAIALSVPALASTATVQAAATTQSQITILSVTGNISDNPCTGEGVLLSGNVIILSEQTVDATGGLHVRFLVSAQGVSGTGLSTGIKYQAVGNDGQFDFNTSGPPPSEFTMSLDFHLVSQGPIPNFVFTLLVRVTINASGNVTAVINNVTFSCVG
jgi:hypothetical protein